MTDLGAISRKINGYFIHQNKIQFFQKEEKHRKKNENLHQINQKILSLVDGNLHYLFNSIDNSNFFGVTKHFMDRFYHLPQLLKESVLRHISGNDYEIRSQIGMKGRAAGSVGLIYDFTASSFEEAQMIEKDYKDRMLGEATRVLLAYWKRANKKKMFHFVDRLSDVMFEIADEKREIYFSTKEKTEFWQNTKILMRTQLTIECEVKPKWSKKPQLLRIPHRMLEIKADLSDLLEKNYPNEVAITVLDPVHFKERASMATAITNSTLKLRPSDIMLALTLQTRGAQRRDSPAMPFKESDLIDLANLSRTARSNVRTARARLSKKIGALRSRGIIENHEMSGGIYYIKTANQRGRV